MKTWIALCALATLIVTTGQANAEEAAVVQRGTAGLSPIPFQVANGSGGPIECDAALAHWYSASIGRADPGGSISSEFWSDAATGVVYMLNDKAERMPLQALWCGVAGQAVSTRADIRFMRRVGAIEQPVTLTCTGRTGDGKLDCRREEVR